MRREILFVVLFLLCIALPFSAEARDKKPVLDLANVQHVFVGWADMDPESAFDLGYSKDEWVDVIRHENIMFQKKVKEGLNSKFTSIATAKDRTDTSTVGNDLYIKFSDVVFDRGYVLHLSVHIIDLKTNSEIASIPNHKYGGSLCGLTTCMEQEFDSVNTKLQILLGGHLDKWARRR